MADDTCDAVSDVSPDPKPVSSPARPPRQDRWSVWDLFKDRKQESPAPLEPKPRNEHLVRNGDRFDMVRDGKVFGSCAYLRVGPEVDAANAKAAAWTPPQRPPVPPELTASDADVVGRWKPAVCFREYQSLYIKKGVEGRYRITYDSGGCFPGPTLDRTGVLRDGRLEFDSPIVRGGSLFSEAVYPIRVEGETVLVLADSIDTLRPRTMYTLESIRGRFDFLQRVKPDDPAYGNFDSLDEEEEAWNKGAGKAEDGPP